MPHTTNWYIQLLTLTVAAACLWLATACGNGSGAEYAIDGRIASSAPCGDNTPLQPSKEFRQFVGPEYLYEFHEPNRINVASRERKKRLRPERERIEAILGRYSELVSRQSNGEVSNHIITWGVMTIQTEEWWPTDKLIIEVAVREHVDQKSFPPEDRIPECMDGIEVHFDAQPYLRSANQSVAYTKTRS